jgi:hypothetical protein
MTTTPSTTPPAHLPSETTLGPNVTPAPSRKSRLPLIVAIAAAVLVLAGGIGIGAAWFFTRGDTPAATAPPAQAVDPALPSVDDETLPDPAPTTAGPALTKSDVKLSLKTTDKQCFGSVGCNVTVQVEAAHADGVGSFKSAETWLVTYEISGDESGPIVGSFEITDGKYDVNEESLSTKSSKTKVSVKVVDVEKVGT